MYHRPGVMHHTVATKAVDHGAPTIEDKVPGVAFKQTAPAWTAGYGTNGSTQKAIAISEAFAIISKGVVMIPKGALTAPRGTGIWITDADNVMATTSGAGKSKFGLVVDGEGQRGCPTGFIRVDLDKKDSF